MSMIRNHGRRVASIFKRLLVGSASQPSIRIGRCAIATSDPREARQVAILASCAFAKSGSFEVNGRKIRWWSVTD